MNILFGANSTIGNQLVKIYESRFEDYLCIGRNARDKNWVFGDLKDSEKINLPMKAYKAKRILFCQRYRPNNEESYSLEDDMATHINGPMNFCRRAFKEFENLQNITMISSGAAQYVSSEQNVEYHIVRAGLESMCKYLAIEFSCRDIAVNTIRVGYVKSQRKIDSRGSGFYDADSYVLPRGFAPNAEEVAKAIDQVSTLSTSVITGQTISVDAGLTLRTHSSLGYSIGQTLTGSSSD